MNDLHAATPPAPPSNYDPVEIAMDALAHNDAALADPARTLLLRQTRLVEAQIAQIHLRRWLIAGFLGVFALIVGAAVWNAASDESLVIDAFTAPPDLQAQGYSGEVVAAMLLDELSAMDAQTETLRARETLKNDWSGDLKVEVPQTGVSLGELDRGLRRWLGHQTHVEGNLAHRGEHLALTVRSSAGSAQTFEGGAGDIEALVRKAAEATFAATQPYLFSKYLEQHERIPEALDVARRVAVSSAPAAERAWAYGQVSNLLFYSDLPAAATAARRGIALEAGNGLAYVNLAGASQMLGHDEDEWLNERICLPLMHANNAGFSATANAIAYANDGLLADLVGDFASAARIYADPHVAESDYESSTALLPAVIAYELARAHDVNGSRAVPDALPDAQMIPHFHWTGDAIVAEYERAAALDDWAAAAASLEPTLAAAARFGYLGTIATQRFLLPRRALALAHMGRIVEAVAVLADTPLDCIRCLRARGVVAALAGDAAQSDRWFTQAVHDAPSLPFAYAEWGEAKLARGDAEGAVALFRQAYEKSSRWADPYKLEGDALVKQNQPGAALDRYADAAERAPHWGGLFRAWGETLDALGRGAEAQTKYRAAAALDLSAADRAAVVRKLAAHS